MESKYTVGIFFQGKPMYTALVTTPEAAMKAIEVSSKMFSDRQGWHIDVSVEHVEREYYETGNGFMRKMIERRERIGGRE